MNSAQRSASTVCGEAMPISSPVLQSVFPSMVASAELRTAALPESTRIVGYGSMAVAPSKRHLEFAAGRLCVRHAASTLGVPALSLDVCADRSPRWPESLTGSITHTDGFCGAVVADRSCFRALGLDAEVVGRMTPEIWPLICVPTELAWLKTLPPIERNAAATLIFSAKECFYKCQYTLTRQWLEFDAIAIRCQGYENGAGWFVAQPLSLLAVADHATEPFIGRFRFDQDLVVAGMAIASARRGLEAANYCRPIGELEQRSMQECRA